jgi:hypothetical protein
MELRVFRVTQHLQVLYSVVGLYAVEVVHDLVPVKTTPQLLLHDLSVSQYRSPTAPADFCEGYVAL